MERQRLTLDAKRQQRDKQHSQATSAASPKTRSDPDPEAGPTPHSSPGSQTPSPDRESHSLVPWADLAVGAIDEAGRAASSARRKRPPPLDMLKEDPKDSYGFRSILTKKKDIHK